MKFAQFLCELAQNFFGQSFWYSYRPSTLEIFLSCPTNEILAKTIKWGKKKWFPRRDLKIFGKWWKNGDNHINVFFQRYIKPLYVGDGTKLFFWQSRAFLPKLKKKITKKALKFRPCLEALMSKGNASRKKFSWKIYAIPREVFGLTMEILIF